MFKYWKGWLAVTISVLWVGFALAGSGTITVKDGGGTNRTYDVVTDGSGNFLAMNVICDYSAGANCASVDSSHRILSTLNSGSVASGAVASGAFASGSIASGAVAAGA